MNRYKQNVLALSVITLLLLTPDGFAVTVPETHCIDAGCDDVPRSGGGSTYSPPAHDYEAERRAREAEDARQAEIEQQHRAAAARRIREEQERQAEFFRQRDEAAGTLKGSHGMSVSGASELKGSSVSSSGLKGSSHDTGLRGSSRAAINTDTSVVDARNVPSGLPKSVDDAIPHTPSGERVRKGFQAIQDGDWKVALAWFKDAHNKEPGNPGIERLVDLAQFTLEYRTKATTPTVDKKSTSAQSVDQKSTAKPSGGVQTKPVTPEDKPANSIEHAAASQMAARARADEARKRYEEKYGDRNVVGRASAVAKAAQGEGYSNEELKAQLQKALMDYRKNHPKGSAKSVGGTPAVEEIILGGKG